MDIDINNYKTVLKKLIYNNFVLNETDDIYFMINDQVLHYRPVGNAYLLNYSGSNQEIFRQLGLDKYKFCEKIYNKKNLEGDFPEYHGSDNTMMCKMVYALFEECVAKTIPVKKLALSNAITKSFLDTIEEDEIKFKKLDLPDLDDIIAGPEPAIRVEPEPVHFIFQDPWQI